MRVHPRDAHRSDGGTSPEHGTGSEAETATSRSSCRGLANRHGEPRGTDDREAKHSRPCEAGSPTVWRFEGAGEPARMWVDRHLARPAPRFVPAGSRAGPTNPRHRVSTSGGHPSTSHRASNQGAAGPALKCQRPAAATTRNHRCALAEPPRAAAPPSQSRIRPVGGTAAASTTGLLLKEKVRIPAMSESDGDAPRATWSQPRPAGPAVGPKSPASTRVGGRGRATKPGQYLDEPGPAPAPARPRPSTAKPEPPPATTAARPRQPGHGSPAVQCRDHRRAIATGLDK
jgi:hypothetical protein